MNAPRAIDTIDKALHEIAFVADRYNAFTKVTDDLSRSKGVTFSWETNQPPAKTLWQSMPDTFGESTAEPKPTSLNQGTDFRTSMLRAQLIRVLQLVADNRPCSVPEARVVLRRLKENLEQVRLCAEILMRANYEYTAPKSPSFFGSKLVDKTIGAVRDMENRMPHKATWDTTRIRRYIATHAADEKIILTGRVMHVKNTKATEQAMAYFLVETDNRGSPPIIRVQNVAAYAMYPKNYYGPGLTEATIADLLEHYYVIPAGQDASKPVNHPRIICEVSI